MSRLLVLLSLLLSSLQLKWVVVGAQDDEEEQTLDDSATPGPAKEDQDAVEANEEDEDLDSRGEELRCKHD